MPLTDLTSTVLAAEIVDFDELKKMNENQATTLLWRMHAELQKKGERYGAEIVKFYEGGILLTFPDHVGALRCAVAAQQEFQLWPEVPVRMGIHEGTVIIEKDKAYGGGIEGARQIESVGVEGAVLISKKVKLSLGDRPKWETRFYGEFSFENREEPVALYALAEEGLVTPAS